VAAIPTNAGDVVVMTVRADLEWIDGNNQRIGSLPARHPNVTILDWNGQSQQVELCPDGVHITCSVEATNFYANLILGELGLPTIS